MTRRWRCDGGHLTHAFRYVVLREGVWLKVCQDHLQRGDEIDDGVHLIPYTYQTNAGGWSGLGDDPSMHDVPREVIPDPWPLIEQSTRHAYRLRPEDPGD